MFSFIVSKTQVEEIHDYRNVAVNKKLRFQNVFRSH